MIIVECEDIPFFTTKGTKALTLKVYQVVIFMHNKNT